MVLVVKNLPASAGDSRDVSLIPGLGKSPGVGNDTPVQYFCLENSISRRAWWATIYGAAKSRTLLSTLHAYNSIIKSNEYLTRDTTWLKLENITLSVRSQAQQVTCCMIPFTWNIQNKENHRNRRQINSFLEQRGERTRDWLLNGIWGLYPGPCPDALIIQTDKLILCPLLVLLSFIFITYLISRTETPARSLRQGLNKG